MDPITSMRERLAGSSLRVALPEATDRRVLEAAARALSEGVCRPVLIGAQSDVTSRLEGMQLESSAFEMIDPATDRDRSQLEQQLAERLAGDRERATRLLDSPHYYAGALTAARRVDGAVMGAEVTTGETLRVALRTVGLEPGRSLLSSCFLMLLPSGRDLIYSDGGVVPDPSPQQLAEIAIAAAKSCRSYLDEEPRVALLSFSTLGSADHPLVTRVQRAVEILTASLPDFAFEGELQADAALEPAVAARKAPDSEVAGRANVLVFPNLDAANIGYKLTERLAGARAIGPLLQGTARPIHDLSRGCSSSDIVDVLTVTATAALEARARERSARTRQESP